MYSSNPFFSSIVSLDFDLSFFSLASLPGSCQSSPQSPSEAALESTELSERLPESSWASAPCPWSSSSLSESDSWGSLVGVLGPDLRPWVVKMWVVNSAMRWNFSSFGLRQSSLITSCSQPDDTNVSQSVETSKSVSALVEACLIADTKL